MFSQTSEKYSDEMEVLQNTFNYAQKLNMDMTRSVSCFVVHRNNTVYLKLVRTVSNYIIRMHF